MLQKITCSKPLTNAVKRLNTKPGFPGSDVNTDGNKRANSEPTTYVTKSNNNYYNGLSFSANESNQQSF